MRNIHSLAVFCGSKIGKSKSYGIAATKLGEEMASRGIKLIFGGGRTGIMGQLADSVIGNGGHAVGVIPHFLSEIEAAHQNLPKLIEVDSMHVRKQTMYDLADGFIILPGGLGTLDECFEIITWKQLKLHKKPIVVLNVEGYWDCLETLISEIASSGFIHERPNNLFQVVSEVEKIFDALLGFVEETVE